MYFGSLIQYNVFNKKNNVLGTWANDCWIEPYAVSAVCQPLNGGWVNNKKLGNIVFTRFQIFTLTMAIEWNIEKCITILLSIKYYPLALFLIGFTILNEKIMQIYSLHANPVMLSSTLLIASAYTSDVISSLESICHYFTIVLDTECTNNVYISFIENNAEPNTSNAKIGPYTSPLGMLCFILHVILSTIWLCLTLSKINKC